MINKDRVNSPGAYSTARTVLKESQAEMPGFTY